MSGNSFQSFFQAILDAVVSKQWWPLASMLIIGLVALSRYVLPKVHGKFGVWINTDRGGVVLNLVWTVLTATATTIGAWKAPSLQLLFSSLIVAVGSAGGFNIFKKLFFPSDSPADLAKAVAKAAPPATPAADAGTTVKNLLPFILIPLLALQGCIPLAECKNPIPANVAKCSLENNLIACGEKTGMSLLPIILDIILGAAGGVFNSDAIVTELEAAGFKNIPCLLAAIEGYLLPGASLPAVALLSGHVHEVLVAKLKKDGHHGEVLVKVKSGYTAKAVLP